MGATTDCNARQVEAKRRFAKGLTFNSTYKWAKNLANNGRSNSTASRAKRVADARLTFTIAVQNTATITLRSGIAQFRRWCMTCRLAKVANSPKTFTRW